MKLITPELVCELPVFAASGLVISSGKFFIVSDDEVSMLHGVPGNFETLNLWDHTLPDDPKDRKKLKPDLECLYLHGHKLFLIPSFSNKNRIHGAFVELGENGEIDHHQTVDFSDLRKNLDKKIPDLNIEGAVVIDNRLHLFQRGNGKDGENTIIICDNLASNDFEMKQLELPDHKGIPITVTDATLKGRTVYFTAVAENTESTYLDGEVVGSFLGTLNENLKVTSLKEIDFLGKPEGLSFDDNGNLYFVTDDDSREKASRLFIIRDH